MRIAVLILGLLFNIVLFMQTIVVVGLGSAIEDEATAGAGAVGVLVSLVWLVASALVLAFPLASTILFGSAGLLGIAVSGDFPDMGVWGGVALVLALMSFFGWRGKKKEAREKALEKSRQSDRDMRLEQLLLHQSSSAATNSCQTCGTSNPAGMKFCGECGTPAGQPVLAS